jgi:hypothetical protein
MRGDIPPLSQYVFMAWCLVKHRTTFYLCFYCLSFGCNPVIKLHSQSHCTSDGQSVSHLGIEPPSGTHDQILVVVKTVAVSFFMGRPPCRVDGSVM